MVARPGHAVHLTVAAHALGPNTSLVCPSQARLLVRTAGRALLLCPDPAAAPLHILSQPASSTRELLHSSIYTLHFAVVLKLYLLGEGSLLAFGATPVGFRPIDWGGGVRSVAMVGG